MLKKTKDTVIVLILIAILNFNPNSLAQNDPDTFLYLTDFDQINLDGIISPKEYPLIFEVRSVGGATFGSLAWGHNTTHLVLALHSIGSGWVAIGMGSVGQTMTNADIIMGAVVDGEIQVKDMFSTGQVEPEEDSDSYIDNRFIGGTEDSNGTTIEMIIPLASDDTSGYDHNWQPNNTYGFFLAYHSTNDDFTAYHTSHTISLEVEILEETAELVTKLDHFLTMTFFEGNRSLVITATVYEANTTNPVEGLELNFYRKTQFGQVLINSSVSNSDGIARIIIFPDFSGNATIISSFPGTQEVEQSEIASYVIIEPEITDTVTEYEDLRDYFGEEHLIRRFLLVCFFIVVLSVLSIYSMVIIDLYRIKKMEKDTLTQQEDI